MNAGPVPLAPGIIPTPEMDQSALNTRFLYTQTGPNPMDCQIPTSMIPTMPPGPRADISYPHPSHAPWVDSLSFAPTNPPDMGNSRHASS